MFKKIIAIIAIISVGTFLSAHEEHGHKTAHGGVLNAISTCENGHAEVKIDGDTLKLWFVGGGSNTLKSVRITDKEIVLTVLVKGEKTARKFVLNAKPNELAEEKVGDCSSFEGKAPWLKDIKNFTADAMINFKGKKQPLKIEFPEGFDPDDDAE